MRSWDRASFELNTRSPRAGRGRIKRRDLLLPAHHDRLKLLGACAVCGVAIGVLYVWFPLVFVLIAVDRPLGPWIWVIVSAVSLVSTVVLYLLADRQMAGYRESVAEL